MTGIPGWQGHDDSRPENQPERGHGGRSGRYSERLIALLTLFWFIVGGCVAMAGSLASMDSYDPGAVSYRSTLAGIWLYPVVIGVIVLVVVRIRRRR